MARACAAVPVSPCACPFNALLAARDRCRWPPVTTPASAVTACTVAEARARRARKRDAPRSGLRSRPGRIGQINAGLGQFYKVGISRLLGSAWLMSSCSASFDCCAGLGSSHDDRHRDHCKPRFQFRPTSQSWVGRFVTASRQRSTIC